MIDHATISRLGLGLLGLKVIGNEFDAPRDALIAEIVSIHRRKACDGTWRLFATFAYVNRVGTTSVGEFCGPVEAATLIGDFARIVVPDTAGEMLICTIPSGGPELARYLDGTQRRWQP